MMTRKKSNLGSVLVLLVFAVFMVSVLLVLLTGADVVQTLTQRDQSSYNQRTAAQYITTRVRQGDQSGMICVRSFAGQDALVLTEEIDGICYETLVYCFDGYLRELFQEVGLDLEPEFGEWILPLEAFRVSDMGDYLQVALTLEDATDETLYLRLRSESGVDP